MQQLTRRSIVVADDDSGVRSVIGAALRQHGWTVREAENGRVALALIQMEVPDWLLTDIEMPEIGGHELIQIVRHSHPSIRIVAMSGHGNYTRARQLLQEAGLNHIVLKPFSVDQLLRYLA